MDNEILDILNDYKKNMQEFIQVEKKYISLKKQQIEGKEINLQPIELEYNRCLANLELIDVRLKKYKGK